MGTSQSGSGPRNNSPLLPPWANDIPQNVDLPNLGGGDGPERAEENAPSNPPPESPSSPPDTNPIPNPIPAPSDIPSVTWSQARRGITRFVRSGSQDKLRRAGSDYVKARGGSSNASKSAIGGRRAAARLGNILSSISNNGWDSTLRSLGLQHLIGREADIIVAEIAEKIAPEAATLEDSIARNAIIETLANLYSKGILADKNTLNEEELKVTFNDYVSSYVYKRWLHELGMAIERYSLSENQARQLEKTVKTYVKNAVDIDFRNYDLKRINWREAGKIVDNIFSEAYRLLEVAG